jgi:hypothetical protein
MVALRPLRESALLQGRRYPEYFFLQAMHRLRFLRALFFAVQNGGAGVCILAGANPKTVTALPCHCRCSFAFLFG